MLSMRGSVINLPSSQSQGTKRAQQLDRDGEGGFTLIELLVVMLILGILAAIALPAFFNQKQKAADAKAKGYAHSAQVAIETFSTDHGGTYAGASKAALIAIEPTLENAKFLGEPISSASGYKFTIEGSAGHHFTIENTNGKISYPCTPKGQGGCPEVNGEGNWGG